MTEEEVKAAVLTFVGILAFVFAIRSEDTWWFLIYALIAATCGAAVVALAFDHAIVFHVER